MRSLKSAPDRLDTAIMSSLQAGIGVEDEPYEKLSRDLGISQEEVVSRIRVLKRNGIVRRFGASIRPLGIGLKANGMVVCKVPSNRIQYIGRYISRMREVTHCYQRKTIPGRWDYNLFFMIHGPARRVVEEHVAAVMKKLNITNYEILYSVEELKKASIEF